MRNKHGASRERQESIKERVGMKYLPVSSTGKSPFFKQILCAIRHIKSEFRRKEPNYSVTDRKSPLL
jgi:hypothetical protein